MMKTKHLTRVHPKESDLAEFLAGSLSGNDRAAVEAHIASCGECLNRAVSAYEAVNLAGKKISRQNLKGAVYMKKMNIYLILAVISFSLSFIIPRYFIQLLVSTLILGIKWIVDAKSTKMLVMIYEAWKSGGEKEASRILETLNSGSRTRL